MLPANRETELKFHVPELPTVDAFLGGLGELGWHVGHIVNREQFDTYFLDEAAQLATLRAALRWRYTDTGFIVSIKQERETDGAHFERFELECPAGTPAHAAGSFVARLDYGENPAEITEWLIANGIEPPFTSQVWLSTNRTTIRAEHAGIRAEFALDTVTAQLPHVRTAGKTFHEIECEYVADQHNTALATVRDYLAALPGAIPSPSSKLDFSLSLL